MAEMEFDGQREGEVVELVFRRHILTTWKGWMWLVIFGVVGFIPMLIWRNEQMLFFVWLGCLVVGILIAIRSYMRWYYSYYLLTNQRIRQIQQRGLFRKSVVDLGLDKIQTITYDVPGVLGGIFGYGTLVLKTQVGDMTISMVRKPEEVYNELQDLASKVEK